MQTNAYYFNLQNLIIFIAVLITLCPTTIKASGFSCGKVFKDKYSVFLFKSPNYLINMLDMTFQFKGVPMKGKLYFNMCMDTTLSNICEEGGSVKGKYIFVNTDSKAPGMPNCLVFNEKDDHDWKYSMFNADSDVVQLDGVKVENSKMEVEVFGGVIEALNDAIDFGHGQLNNIMGEINQNLKQELIPQEFTGLNNHFKDMVNKIEIDSSPSKRSKYRLLTGTPKYGQYLTVTPSKNKFVDDVTEEGNVMKKRLNNHILGLVKKQMQNMESQDKQPVDNESQIIQELITDNDLKNKTIDQDSEILTSLRRTFLNKMAQNSMGNHTNNRILTKESQKISDHIENLKKNILSEEFKTETNFYCDTENPKIVSHFLPTQSLLQINVFSSDGCVINFEFLQLLNEIPWLTGAIFLILGIGLAFIGIKVYKNLLIVFIPMMIAILGFYLYFALVENSKTSTTKILTLVGLLVFIFIIAVLMVWFNWLIYLIIAFGVSCQFGLLAQSFLAQNVEFFAKPYTEWILIILFFVLFTVMYILAKDYFVILSTAIMGSLFFMLSLKYLGLTDFDLLFDLQIEKLVDFGALDSEVQKMSLVFIGVLILGTIVQVVLMKRTKANEEKEKEMQNIHDTNKNVNIQLENI